MRDKQRRTRRLTYSNLENIRCGSDKRSLASFPTMLENLVLMFRTARNVAGCIRKTPKNYHRRRKTTAGRDGWTPTERFAQKTHHPAHRITCRTQNPDTTRAGRVGGRARTAGWLDGEICLNRSKNKTQRFTREIASALRFWLLTSGFSFDRSSSSNMNPKIEICFFPIRK